MTPVAAVPVFVLTAGLGTRLHPLSCQRAKPALPVAGTPLICRILAWLARQGVTGIVLNLHHRPATITREVGDGSALGVTVRYSWEPRLLGTAGGPRRALPLLDSDVFFIVNGDTLTDVRLQAVLDDHRESRALITMAVMPNPHPSRYGGVLVDGAHWVQGFAPAGSTDPGRHFVGVQVVQAAAFADLPDGEPASTVSGLYPTLLQRPRSIRAVEVDGPFRDIGTAADYLDTSLAVAAHEGLAAMRAGERILVDPSARVVKSVLWNDVVIEADCDLEECVVGDGVRVPAGTRLRRSSIVPAASCPPRQGDRLAGDLLISPFHRPHGTQPAPTT